MKTSILLKIVVVSFCFITIFVPTTHVKADTRDVLLEKIQELTEIVEQLKRVLAAKPEFTLSAGSTTECSEAKIKEILAPVPATGKWWVEVDCGVVLPKDSVVTKMVSIEPEASGTVFDCNGSTLSNRQSLQVISRHDTTTGVTQQASDITVRNCVAKGSLNLTSDLSADAILSSSRKANHTDFMRSVAPTSITFENITYEGSAEEGSALNGIYASFGTTYFTLKDSVLGGSLRGVPLYLDAESAHNTIINNEFKVDTVAREQLAIDGSSDNLIEDNTFYFGDRSTSPVHGPYSSGAIQMYRNCGENSQIRHNEPRRNRIEDNSFIYDGSANVTTIPGVWLGSRNKRTLSWCSDDVGYAFGSSVSNQDFARDNEVVDNYFVKLDKNTAVRNDDTDNEITGSTFSVKTDGTITTIDTTKYPGTASIYWTGSDNFKSIAKGDRVKLGTTMYRTSAASTVGRIFVKQADAQSVKVGDEVDMYPSDGTITAIDTTKYANTATIYWTGSETFKSIAKGERIKIGSEVYTTSSNSTVGRIFLALADAEDIEVGDEVFMNP